MNDSLLPNHIAIIPDGNRRWASARGINKIEGHIAGYNAMVSLIDEALKIGIKYLTFFCFSTENQKRSEQEVSYLKNIFYKYLKLNIPKLIKNNIKLNVIGDISYFDDKIITIINSAVSKTCECNKLTLTIALNYGSHLEIVNATKNIAKDVIAQKISIDDISEQLFANYLYTKGLPNPDLLIRTSGEYRLSNFLLWQISYSELFFSEKLFPDFTKDDLQDAIAHFQSRTRRYGK